MHNNVLAVSHLVKQYGSFTAVDNISFSVSPRQCVALLGTNGAGKTTTMKMIYSATPITSGSISIEGLDVQTNARKTKGILGIVSQADLMDGTLNVWENLYAHGICYGIPRRELKHRIARLLEFIGLSNYKDKDITSLSGGMCRRLVLARALINNPRLIILDEPTTGLDIQSRHVIWKKLQVLKAQGVSLLLTSHYMDEVERLANQVLIIHQGQILASGTPAALVNNSQFDNLEDLFLHLTGFNEEDDHIVQSLA